MAYRGLAAGAFGAIAGGTVVFILEGVPRVQNDILKKLPLIGGYWTGREKPASDNVCSSFSGPSMCLDAMSLKIIEPSLSADWFIAFLNIFVAGPTILYFGVRALIPGRYRWEGEGYTRDIPGGWDWAR